MEYVTLRCSCIFLLKQHASFFHSAWVMASSRAVMTDEVKQAGKQWVSVTARLFFKDAFHQAVTGVVEMPGEARDADAVSTSLRNAFNCQGVKAWLDDCLVALCERPWKKIPAFLPHTEPIDCLPL